MYKLITRSSWLTLLSLVLLETGVRFFNPSAANLSLVNADTTPELKQEPWIEQWYQESSQLRRVFQPYDLYRLQALPGEILHIDNDGRRRSLYRAPRFATSPHATRVAFFGGSTVWGYLARDAFTLPSWVGNELTHQNDNLSFRLENDGEIGQVASQELHRAIRLLYASDRLVRVPEPRLMIFVDGIDDSLAALLNAAQGVSNPAGLPEAFNWYRSLFDWNQPNRITLSEILARTAAYPYLRLELQKRGWVDSHSDYGQPQGQLDWETLSEQVADKYLEVVSVAQRTLSADGSVPVFILQPTINHKTLSPSETVLVSQNQNWLPFLKLTYKKIIQKSDSLDAAVKWINLSELFAAHSETLFSDVTHYSEFGNQVLGVEIANHLRPLLERMSSPESILSHAGRIGSDLSS